MADSDKPKFDIPWATLLPLVAVLAGVIAQYKPLVSKRPAVPSENTIPVIAAQDVDARLWQDPFSVAEKQKSLLDAQIVANKGSAELHDVSSLVKLLGKRAMETRENERVLLLAVMVDAGPYSEQGESRLRARPAVLEALSESGFVPLDGEHIGFVTADWPPVDDPSGARRIDRGLLLPWEECIANRNLACVYPENTRRLILLWLPAASFNPNPLSRLANIIDQLAGDVRNKIDIKLIGPANSTGLQSMVRELHRQSLRADAKDTLKNVSIISPLATASDDTLLFRPTAASGGADVPPTSPAKTVQMFLEEAVPGLTFFRTIATDEVILRELMVELARRRVPVVRKATPGSPVPKVAHVVILTEWDTPYGRSLSTIFAAQASGLTINEILMEPDSWPIWVHPYRYLRGIDGQLPGDQAKESQRDQTQKTQLGQDTVAIEATEGLNQSDYLRRVARQMKEDNARWQREDGSGIRAIGLLGQDIYDKLMILRALRPQFPGAVFFTNNYDAHFERRDDWGDTHNLIIVSPYGSTLPETYVEGHIPPFRDNNQTSMYVGTLVATGRMTKEDADSLSWQPRIFEISRHGAYDLSPAWYLKDQKNANSNKSWFRDWLFPNWGPAEQDFAKTHKGTSLGWHLPSRVIWSSRNFWLIVIGALALAAIVAWISVTIASPTLKGGGTTPQRLRRVFASTTFCLVCGVPLIIFSVAMFGQYKNADFAQYDLGSPARSDYLTKPGVLVQLVHIAQEPLAFFSGISIWPSEMLRLIALLLAIHFMVKAGMDLRANERELGERFCLDPLPKTRFRWHHLGLGLEQWRMTRSDKSGTEPEFSAQEAWHAYLCRNKFWPRFIRIGVLFTLYLSFSFVILKLFPPPPPPARGDLAFQFDRCAIFFTAIGMMILSFYVVDAIQLNSNFIRMFARVVTKWGDTVVEKSWRSPPLSEDELSAYNEIFFVADRTHVVARLIWYPLIVLTLMIVARSSLFDNWSWSPGLLAIYAINACWALGSAILLRRAAEQLRAATLSNLQLSRVRGHASEAKRATFDELIAEIRGLKKGAFAPLTDQPFIRAVLFPGAGLGLLAVAQRLFDLF